ncbi:KUP/HAK/KT family potassium transporter, partial [Brevundimonas bullata]|uniref:KUP/HAK/KT family potassium transporter n=1 Tax=Brevundimonas bullata TaxID=13160 RepID=UPI002FD9DC35
MAGDTPRGDADTAAANASEQPNAGTPSPPHQGAGHGKATHRALILGAIGVVFGDIGTSPIYALRE